MNHTKRRLLRVTTRILLSVTILALAGAIYSLLQWTAPQVQVSDTATAPLRVAVIGAKKIVVQRQWRGYGVAAAIDSADVPARVTATVEQIPANILAGEWVKKGQLLVQLDEGDFRRQVEIAQQNLAELDAQMALIDIDQQQLEAQLKLESQDVSLAEDELTRIEQLLERGAANPRDVDVAKRAVIAVKIALLATIQARDALGPRRLQIEAQRSAFRSQLRQADQNLKRCRIDSPIDGVLQLVDVEVGESLDSGQRVARVVNLDRLEVPLRLPASVRGGLSIGDNAQLRVTNQTGLTWSAKVSRIGPEDDASTRTVTAYIEIAQHDRIAAIGFTRSGIMTPGMFVAGVVTSGQAQARWVLPRRSVQDSRVLLVDNGLIRLQPVRVDYMLEGQLPAFGLSDDQWTVLDANVNPLHEGDLVVINASTSVRAGQAVDPVVLTAVSVPSTTQGARP